MHIIRYAIRDAVTGEYLPEPAGRMGRGGSFVEPCLPVIDDLSTHPRLFVSERGGISALAQWRRGKHHPEYDFEENRIGRLVKTDAGTSVEFIPERLERKMHIVPIKIPL